MIRDGEYTKYTDEDRENLTIRIHTPTEIGDNKRNYARKQWKRRLIITIIFLFFVLLTGYVGSGKPGIILAMFTMLIGIFMLWAEFAAIYRARKAWSRYYVELRITEKLNEETYCDSRSETGGFESFYPVMAVDTTSGYECRYYLSRDEYEIAEPGRVLKTNVLLRDMKERKEKSFLDIRMTIGVIFMLASGMMIPGIIYSVITESEKLLYGGIAAFIICFFALGVGIVIIGIRDMKNKRN